MFHPFYVKNVKNGEDETYGMWKASANLVAGDELLTEDGRVVYVEEVKVERLAESIEVYNLEVEGLHTYYVGSGILVHNDYAKGNDSNGNSSSESGEKTYTVDPSMQAKDIEMGVLIDGAYIKNPTAQNMSDLIKPGSNYVGNSKMNGQFMYVVDTNGNIVIGSRAGQHMPHPTLIGGTNPTVQGAGIVEIRGGKIYSIDNASGHFKPDSSCMTSVQNAFGQLPSNVFHKDFQGYSTVGD